MNRWRSALLVCLILAALSPLASSGPDGLEKVAENGGFAGLARGAPFQAIANYAFPGIESPVMAAILAGLVGTLLVFGLMYGLASLIRARGGRRDT